MNILTRFCLLNTSSKSMVLKLFHVKDPQNYMYLAADLHLEKGMFQGPPEAEIFESQTFALKNIYSKISTNVTIFQK